MTGFSFLPCERRDHCVLNFLLLTGQERRRSQEEITVVQTGSDLKLTQKGRKVGLCPWPDRLNKDTPARSLVRAFGSEAVVSSLCLERHNSAAHRGVRPPWLLLRQTFRRPVGMERSAHALCFIVSWTRESCSWKFKTPVVPLP